jgi:hypothetical protein
MSRKQTMTWEKARSRWRKMFEGKVYTVSPKELGTPATKEASQDAANEWWEAKQAELEGRNKIKPGSPQAVQKILEAWAGQPIQTTEDIVAAVLGL